MLTIDPKLVAKAQEIDDQVAKEKEGLSRFNSAVRVVHQEGTALWVESAYAVDYDKWIFVIAEHHPLMVFWKDDLENWGQYKHAKIKKVS